MKILWEDVLKYGTREEVEFLTEIMGTPLMQFIALKKQFVDGPGSKRDKLTPEESEALQTIEQFKTFADLKNWYDSNPDLVAKFTEIFKMKLGQIYKGAFDFAKR